MNWYKLFYLMTTADRLQDFFDVLSNISTWLLVVAFIGTVVTSFGYAGAVANCSRERLETDTEILAWKLAKKYCIGVALTLLPICLLSWFLYVATPSKKDALLIVAGGAVGTFITSDSSASKLPADITNFLRAKIMAETNELSLDGVFPEKDTLKQLSKEQLIELIRKSK